MNKLENKLKKLMRNKELRGLVSSRLKEFKANRNASKEKIFKELCFCILTANFSAERSIRIQKRINNGFLTLSQKALAKRLKDLGHRYPNTRAKYIVAARKHINFLKELLNLPGAEAREWLVKNVKGLGYKEASHFLRNVGFDDLAILDFHILDILERNGIVKRPKTLTKKRYMDIENILRKIADTLDIKLSELDLYLWYIETRKVLK